MDKQTQIILSCAEFSTSGTSDTPSLVSNLVEYVLNLEHLPAAISIFPSTVGTAGVAMGEAPIRIAALCGAYPTGQSYLEVKLLECAMAIENGAEEIEVTANIGAAMDEDFDAVGAEIEALKAEIADDALLKVNIESALFEDTQQVYDLAMAVMRAGADFVCTSSSFQDYPNDEEIFAVATAIKDYYKESSRKVGIKCMVDFQMPDGIYEVTTPILEVLGTEWITPSLLRLDITTIIFEPQPTFEDNTKFCS